MHWRRLYLASGSAIALWIVFGDAGRFNWFVHGYGWDIALPFLVYFVFRNPQSEVSGGEMAVLAFLPCALGESLQPFLSNYTFDWWDYVAYAGGAGGAFLLDSVTPRSAETHIGESEEARSDT